MTTKPSDLAAHKRAIAQSQLERGWDELTYYAEQTTYLMDHFTKHGHDVDTALALTEITLDRYL